MLAALPINSTLVPCPPTNAITLTFYHHSNTQIFHSCHEENLQENYSQYRSHSCIFLRRVTLNLESQTRSLTYYLKWQKQPVCTDLGTANIVITDNVLKNMHFSSEITTKISLTILVVSTARCSSGSSVLRYIHPSHPSRLAYRFECSQLF